MPYELLTDVEAVWLGSNLKKRIDICLVIIAMHYYGQDYS